MAGVSLSPIERENWLPIGFHVDDDPAAPRRFVQRCGQLADMALPIIGVLSYRIVVMADQPSRGAEPPEVAAHKQTIAG